MTAKRREKEKKKKRISLVGWSQSIPKRNKQQKTTENTNPAHHIGVVQTQRWSSKRLNGGPKLLEIADGKQLINRLLTNQEGISSTAATIWK